MKDECKRRLNNGFPLLVSSSILLKKIDRENLMEEEGGVVGTELRF